MQALTLMNDPAYVEMAQAFAARVQREAAGLAPPAQIEHAFRLAVARRPGAKELEALKNVFSSSIDTGGSEKEAWFDVATTLLNLHETITK